MKINIRVATRNQRMDYYKGIAIYFVLFIHVLFPGPVGTGVRVLGRFAVPLFFLSAGFFAFATPTRILARRMRRTFLLWVVSCVPYALLGCWMTVRNGGEALVWLKSLCTMEKLQELLLHQTVPFPYAWQLWFLGVLFLVYFVWWLMSALRRSRRRTLPYEKLATIAVTLLVIHLLLGEGLGLFGWEVDDNRILRGAILDGFPFFALGAWTAMRRKELEWSNLPWRRLMLLGVALSLAEGCLAGKEELYAGTLLLLAGLMGKAASEPEMTGGLFGRWFRYCGQYLTFKIYVIHLVILGLIRELGLLEGLPYSDWLEPVAVAIASTLAALLLRGIQTLFTPRRRAEV